MRNWVDTILLCAVPVWGHPGECRCLASWCGWELCNICALQCQHLLRTPTFASQTLPAMHMRRKAKPWWIRLISAAPFTGLAALGTSPLCTFGQKAWRGFLASCIVSAYICLKNCFFLAHIDCSVVKLTVKYHLQWGHLWKERIIFTLFSKTA